MDQIISNLERSMPLVGIDPTPMIAFWKCVHQVNDVLLRLIARALGLAEDALFLADESGKKQTLEEYNGFLDTILYRGEENYKDGGEYMQSLHYRVTPHTDIDFLTTLVPDAGLQALCRGRWYDIEPDPPGWWCCHGTFFPSSPTTG